MTETLNNLLDEQMKEVQEQIKETEQASEQVPTTEPTNESKEQVPETKEKSTDPKPMEKLIMNMLKETLKEFKKFALSKKGLETQTAEQADNLECDKVDKLTFTDYMNTTYELEKVEEKADQNGVAFQDLIRQGITPDVSTDKPVYGIGKSQKPFTQRINDMKSTIDKAEQEAIKRWDEHVKSLEQEQAAQAQTQEQGSVPSTTPEPTKGE